MPTSSIVFIRDVNKEPRAVRMRLAVLAGVEVRTLESFARTRRSRGMATLEALERVLIEHGYACRPEGA